MYQEHKITSQLFLNTCPLHQSKQNQMRHVVSERQRATAGMGTQT